MKRRNKIKEFVGVKLRKNKDADIQQFVQDIDDENIEILKEYDFSDIFRASLRMAKANPNKLMDYLENYRHVESQIQLDELLKSG